MQRQPDKTIALVAAFCAVVWIVAAVNPLDRQAWLLENLLVVGVAVLLFFTRRQLQFSTLSWLLLAGFLLLHIVGAHYTYAKMPLGFWAQEQFGLSRNHYDRVVHFAFGLLLVYPVRELLLRFSGITRGWSYYAAIAVIVAASGIFEIIEWLVAEIVAPGAGVEWLGAQGDEWDSQNDMLMALLGACVAMAFTAWRERRRSA